jgi:hypothetical protein
MGAWDIPRSNGEDCAALAVRMPSLQLLLAPLKPTNISLRGRNTPQL